MYGILHNIFGFAYSDWKSPQLSPHFRQISRISVLEKDFKVRYNLTCRGISATNAFRRTKWKTQLKEYSKRK